MAASSAKLPTWYRVLATIVGLMSIALALVVLVAPVLAVWLLIFLLAFGLLFIGMDRLVIGISGQPLWWVGPMTPPNPSAPTLATPVSTPAPKP
jgi:hypothetical protein